jgi:hypothetical protein
MPLLTCGSWVKLVHDSYFFPGRPIRSTVAFATSRSLFSSLGIWTSVRPLKAGHTTRAANGPSFQAPIINGWVFSLKP